MPTTTSYIPSALKEESAFKPLRCRKTEHENECLHRTLSRTPRQKSKGECEDDWPSHPLKPSSAVHPLSGGHPAWSGGQTNVHISPLIAPLAHTDPGLFMPRGSTDWWQTLTDLSVWSSHLIHFMFVFQIQRLMSRLGDELKHDFQQLITRRRWRIRVGEPSSCSTRCLSYKLKSSCQGGGAQPRGHRASSWLIRFVGPRGWLSYLCSRWDHPLLPHPRWRRRRNKLRIKKKKTKKTPTATTMYTTEP